MKTTLHAIFTVVSFVTLMCLACSAHAAVVHMEDMTWMEIRSRMQAGATTAIIPVGGTEQNGPQLVTGKHNMIVRYTAGEIAKRLGDVLVAPVVAYVPEGRIDPPEGHMQFPGTISISDAAFQALLEDVARSLKQHGFKLICFIGDHGGTQEGQKRVAEKLNAEWRADGIRVLHVSDYYAKNGQEKWLSTAGVKVKKPDAHAGFSDTSELMAIDGQAVREDLRGVRTESDYNKTGAMGDSTKASVNYGRRLLSLKIEAAMDQIQDVYRKAR